MLPRALGEIIESLPLEVMTIELLAFLAETIETLLIEFNESLV